MRPSVARATVCAAMFVLLGVPEARAADTAADEPSLALGQFHPAPAGDSFFGVPSPYVRGNLVPRAVVMFDYADQPLCLEVDDQQGSHQIAVMGRQAFFLLNASLSIQSRLLVSAVLPVAVVQKGNNSVIQGQPIASSQPAQLGDLRLGARVRILGEDTEPFQLAVSFDGHIPTAPKGGFAGEGAFRAAPQIIVGGRFKAGLDFAWSAAMGALVRRSNPTLITYSAAFATSLWNDLMQIGPELYAATPVQPGTFSLTQDLKVEKQVSTNVELLFGVRMRLFRNVVVGWALGPGLTKAIGTPEMRFVGSVGWSPGLPVQATRQADRDEDRIPDIIDACPDAAGPASPDRARNGCPVLDDDEDGILNQEDACPNDYGVRDKNPKKHGCPRKAPPAPPKTP